MKNQLNTRKCGSGNRVNLTLAALLIAAGLAGVVALSGGKSPAGRTVADASDAPIREPLTIDPPKRAALGSQDIETPVRDKMF